MLQRVFSISVLLYCLAFIGCVAMSPRFTKSHVADEIWTLELHNFSWSNSPRQSIARLETLVRAKAGNNSICFIWPSDVDCWVSKPLCTETANVITLIHSAASGTGLDVVHLKNNIIFTTSVNETFTPLTVFLNITESDTGVLLDDVKFSSDILLPLNTRRIEAGLYAVTIYAPLPFNHFAGVMLTTAEELFSPIVIRAELDGYIMKEQNIQIVGDANIPNQYKINLTKR